MYSRILAGLLEKRILRQISVLDMLRCDSRNNGDCGLIAMAHISNMDELGSPAHDFSLPNTNPRFGGETVSMGAMNDRNLLLVAFICNHCPYVIHIRDSFVEFASDYQRRGLGLVAICSNDVLTHPDDSPERMAEEALKFGYSFPYLFDETQSTAKVYRAACTPDFFLYDQNRKLAYRGQYDSSRPGNNEPVTGKDLSAAVDCLLEGLPVSIEQRPSVGCNIKWKSGEEPDYFDA